LLIRLRQRRGAPWCRRLISGLFRSQAWVRSCASTCKIFVGQSSTGTGVCPTTSLLPSILSFHRCSILTFICVLILPDGQAGKTFEYSKKQCFRKSGSIREQFTFTFRSDVRRTDCALQSILVLD